MTKKKDEVAPVVELPFKDADFVINGQRGFNLDKAMRLWKTKYQGEFHTFERQIIKHEIMYPMRDYVKSFWDDIIPISVEEAFKEKNMEIRRVYFDCIGVTQLFKALEPRLLDKKVVNKDRARWDDKNKERSTNYDDVYELYAIDSKKLFTDENQNRTQDVYAVRCSCPSTDREYWIYVPQEAAVGGTAWKSENDPDAIRAIAWTIQLDITNPKKIFRQGDIIIAEESDDSKVVAPYHISKEQYLELMYSET